LKTKGTLTFIVTITGAILFLAASFLLWNSIAAYRKINTVTPSLEALGLLFQQTKENKPWNTRCP
jgi:Na+-transporting NADH:ubiquinone oxidoreductase subunit NqrB